jgi:hypothetical protein
MANPATSRAQLFQAVGVESSMPDTPQGVPKLVYLRNEVRNTDESGSYRQLRSSRGGLGH